MCAWCSTETAYLVVRDWASLRTWSLALGVPRSRYYAHTPTQLRCYDPGRLCCYAFAGTNCETRARTRQCTSSRRRVAPARRLCCYQACARRSLTACALPLTSRRSSDERAEFDCNKPHLRTKPDGFVSPKPGSGFGHRLVLEYRVWYVLSSGLGGLGGNVERKRGRGRPEARKREIAQTWMREDRER
eukprot:684647-Rhodomonas_salina.1